MTHVQIEKQSKPLACLKKGDSLFFNGKEMKVDSHYLFMDHGSTREMIIEAYSPENEREYQVRYFDDQVETSIEVFELVGDFQYVKREPKTIGW